jgi:hypothetical protein
MMGNSAAICEKHYAAYIPGAHARLAGALDAAPAVPTPTKGAEASPAGAQVTPEGAAVA